METGTSLSSFLNSLRNFSLRTFAVRAVTAVSVVAMLMMAAQGTALARGGGGGGGHGGGHAAFGAGGFGGRAGFAGRGGYGRGYGYGRGFYGGYGWGGWGWGWGLGLGLWLSVLPWDYETLWWDGVPYYYADNNYYNWDPQVGEYQQVQPPPQVAQQAAAQPAEELFAYPEKNQSEQQQATDKDQCRSWARGQTGYNPANAGSIAAPNAPPGEVTPGAYAPAGGNAAPGTATYSTAPTTAVGALTAATGDPAPGASAPGTSPAQAQLTERSAYLRAEAACLQARGYSVR